MLVLGATVNVNVPGVLRLKIVPSDNVPLNGAAPFTFKVIVALPPSHITAFPEIVAAGRALTVIFAISEEMVSQGAFLDTALYQVVCEMLM